MEVYILDSLFRRDTVVDTFESLVWTERGKEIGDFELHIRSNATNQAIFLTGTRLMVNKSKRVMTVETVENITDTEGRKLLKVKGRSLEMILEDRVAIKSAGAGKFLPEWTIKDVPSGVMRQLFAYICSFGDVNASDVIPFLEHSLVSSLYPPEGIPEPDFEILWAQKPAALYSALKELGDIFDLGFRMYRGPDSVAGAKIYFNVYTGSDRTVHQSVLPPVVFSPELGNLLNTSDLRSKEKAKNTAFVFYAEKVQNQPDVIHTQTVYTDWANAETAGFDRHTVFVEVNSIPEEETNIAAYLIRQGKDALAKARPFRIMDGEISQRSGYVYEVDYFLGDLTTMQNSDGMVNTMRVTEQIFVHDNEGERSYPTLVINNFVEPGAWQAFRYNKSWADMGATEYWNTQPL